MSITDGGVLSASTGLVVASAGLTAHEPQSGDVTASPAVLRLRTAAINDQWHDLLDDVYASCFAPVES